MKKKTVQPSQPTFSFDSSLFLNELKEIAQTLGDVTFVENCNNQLKGRVMLLSSCNSNNHLIQPVFIFLLR